MKKKAFGLLAILLLSAGCGKIPKLKDGKEAVVSFKNGEKISVDDLYEKMKDTYALSSLVTMIDTYVLEKTFPDYIDTAKESAKSYMDSLRSNYETDEELLQAIQSYTGMNSVEAYEEYLYLNYMQTHATEEYEKSLVTDEQIKDYYDKAEGDINVSHILITPEVKSDMKDKEKEAAEKKAKEKAEKILTELKAGDPKKVKETFKELAKKHSDDAATKKDGGALGKVNRDKLSSSYDDLVEKAYSIKDGEYYDGIIKSELGYHIILRTGSHDKAKLKTIKKEIKEILAKKLYATDSTMGYKAMDNYRKKLGMEIQDSELQTKYAYYINNQTSNSSK